MPHDAETHTVMLSVVAQILLPPAAEHSRELQDVSSGGAWFLLTLLLIAVLEPLCALIYVSSRKQ